jgi:ketosteroid isomerase-like protein
MGPNEKALREVYVVYSSGTAPVASFAETVVWTSVGAPNRIEIAGEWRGLEGVHEYFAALADHWTVSELTVEEIVGQDDRRFAVRLRVNARSNATGKVVRFEKADLVTMENGKITNYAEIYDTAPLIRAARLA